MPSSPSPPCRAVTTALSAGLISVKMFLLDDLVPSGARHSCAAIRYTPITTDEPHANALVRRSVLGLRTCSDSSLSLSFEVDESPRDPRGAQPGPGAARRMPPTKQALAAFIPRQHSLTSVLSDFRFSDSDKTRDKIQARARELSSGRGRGSGPDRARARERERERERRGVAEEKVRFGIGL